MPTIESDALVRKSLSTFLILFLVLGALLGGMVAVFYQLQTQNYDKRLRAEERHSLELQLAVARNHFTSIISDLFFLAGQGALKAYLEDPFDHHLKSVRSEYLTYSTSKKTYDQIRYLDVLGQEVARVNYNAGEPAIVAQEKLQNKFSRYYFSDTFRLGKGEVFISPLDLNVERGEVERPYKPMIRLGTPVFDQSGNKRGIVLLNYLGQHLLNLIQDVAAVAHGQTMLVNGDGYWLMHPDSDQEWGFMFPDKSHLSFAQQSPDIWMQIMATPAGQFRTVEGIYTFTSLSPLGTQTGDLVKSGDYFWKIVSFISAENIASYSKTLLVNLLFFGVGLLLLAAIVAWFLAIAVTRRKLYQAELFSMAHFDSLTGLPNRALFFDRLSQSLELSRRHSRLCALLYIDLDGFKHVNDSLGHDAGDDLLVSVAKRMLQCCRDSDTVARLGGDEFAILLTEVNSAEGAQVCAEKILAVFEESFTLRQGESMVGTSIGIGMFPAHGATLDDLLKSADQAMYVSKSRGKNTFTFAEKH
ncbi:MAG: diguanylate cyclase [Desulfuromusa sp.]|nr:diguanylate cyclase [Desulfuromusa sp.]